MGVLIVAGTVALVVLLIQRAGGGSVARPGFSVSLDAPEGARISGVAATDRAIAIWVTRPDGDRVVLVDPQSGRRTGEIRLHD
ncbi:DUF6476 family protein [Roseomonas sp. HF4]|uniref:DUF6476 family protein n=1 Tax=Roseomonas sp. HF4 TaxID=2562313 RepID=UPI001485716F|nr:DUF6476 family protein [Roseomonas sp. HF4]